MQPGLARLEARNATPSLGLAGPSYAQQVMSGATPMSDPASAARFAAANQRIAAATAPIPEPGAGRLTDSQMLDVAAGRAPTSLGLAKAIAQGRGREGSP